MNAEMIILAALNVSAVYFLWFYLFRRYFVDSHRHELFKLRYKLFDYALENDISFEHPAFKLRWDEINAMIRYTHETHLMLFAGIFTRKKNISELNEYLKQREEVLNSLTDGQKKFFEDNRNEQLKLFLAFVIKSSGILLLAISIFVIIVALVAFLIMLWKQKNIINKIRPHINNAYDEYEYLALKTI